MKFINLLFMILSACTMMPVPVAVTMVDPFPLRVSKPMEPGNKTVTAPTGATSTVSKATVGDPLVEVVNFNASIKGVIKTLEKLDGAKHKKIYIKINSYGGSIHWGMELIQALEKLKTPVVCVVDWKAESMGAMLLESPGCKTRLMTKRSVLLFHEPLVMETGGNAHALRDMASQLEALSKALAAAAAERIQMPEADFYKRIENKTWNLDYHDALKFKAVDGIIDPKELPAAVPSEPPSIFELLFGS